MSADSWRGRRVDRFEVTGLLGKGATGAVYRALDVVAGREVALKVLLHTRLEPRQRARFQREGELTAALDHPGIVRVHTAGELPGGVPFLAYELVEGARSLEDACTAEPDLSRRVAWVRDVARALGVAHAQGIVHRDVKPDNLLVDAHGHVKVADFGAAWFTGAEQLTVTGGLVGTPYFMPPEQLAGLPATAAGDVWSLGVTLYTVLTGEYPFDASSIDELRMKVLGAEPVALRKKNPGVSPAVERVCLHCLAKAPADRYPHGAALAADLDRALAGESVRAPRVPRLATTRTLLVAAPLLAITGALTLAALAPVPAPPTGPAVVAPVATRAPLAPVVSAASATEPKPSAPPGPRLRAPAGITGLGAEAWRESEAGHAVWMNLVGDFFNDGSHGYPIDPAEGARWYERGAALGDTNCMADLADMLLDGRLKPSDPRRAVALLERASDLGHVWATKTLTEVHRESGDGVPPDWAKAAFYMERVGRLDAAEGRFLAWAGDLVRTGGPNLAPDLPRAVALYEAGAARDDPHAMYRLGQVLAEGQGAPRDLPRARELLERAAQRKVDGARDALRALPPE